MASRLSHYMDLTEQETSVLEELEKSPTEINKGDILFSEGDETSELFIVQKGWLASSTMLMVGERQTLQLHFPGSMVGSASIAFNRAMATVEAVSEVRLCRFPRTSLGDLFGDQPRLSALFYSVAMLEQVDLCDRLKALGRTQGKARLANLLLSIFAQLRVIQGDDLNELKMPLRQTDMADAIGLTPVYVNRVLSELADDRLIERVGKTIRILDEDRLEQIGEFENRFKEIDTSWFPEAPST